MRTFMAKLTVVQGPVYAFEQRMRVGHSITRRVTAFDEDEMIKGKDGKLSNPKNFEAMEIGYRDVPCPGCFRVEEISTDPAARTIPMRDKIADALTKLDHADATQWDFFGRPRVDVVSTLVGQPVTADEIDDAIPGFERKKPLDA